MCRPRQNCCVPDSVSTLRETTLTMRFRILVAGVACAACTFLASAANATPLTVSETSFGSDFDNAGPGSALGNLDIGVNTLQNWYDTVYADAFWSSRPTDSPALQALAKEEAAAFALPARTTMVGSRSERPSM